MSSSFDAGGGHVDAEGEAALPEDLEVVRELVAAVLHLRERRGLAAGREARGLRQPLRVVLHLRGHGHVGGVLRSRRGVDEHHERGEGHEAEGDGAQDVHLRRDRQVADQGQGEGLDAAAPRADAGFFAPAAPMVDVGPPGTRLRSARPAGSSSWTRPRCRGPRRRLRLGREETSRNEVRERRLGFCRWCFGHVCSPCSGVSWAVPRGPAP